MNLVEAPNGLENVGGFSVMEPYNNKQTIYYYAPIIEASLPVPNVAERYLAKVTLSGYLNAIKNRTEDAIP